MLQKVCFVVLQKFWFGIELDWVVRLVCIGTALNTLKEPIWSRKRTITSVRHGPVESKGCSCCCIMTAIFVLTVMTERRFHCHVHKRLVGLSPLLLNVSKKGGFLRKIDTVNQDSIHGSQLLFGPIPFDVLTIVR